MVQGAQEQAYDELARIREERDDSLKALHDAQLHAKDLEVREEGWKAAVSSILYVLCVCFKLIPTF